MTGPSNWHALFENSCLGLYQSPINIDREMTIYNPDINDFIFWYDPPAPNAEFYVFNNGHTGRKHFNFFFSVFFFDNLNYDSTYSIDFLKLFNYNPYSAFFFKRGGGL